MKVVIGVYDYSPKGIEVMFYCPGTIGDYVGGRSHGWVEKKARIEIELLVLTGAWSPVIEGGTGVD